MNLRALALLAALPLAEVRKLEDIPFVMKGGVLVKGGEKP